MMQIQFTVLPDNDAVITTFHIRNDSDSIEKIVRISWTKTVYDEDGNEFRANREAKDRLFRTTSFRFYKVPDDYELMATPFRIFSNIHPNYDIIEAVRLSDSPPGMHLVKTFPILIDKSSGEYTIKHINGDIIRNLIPKFESLYPQPFNSFYWKLYKRRETSRKPRPSTARGYLYRSHGQMSSRHPVVHQIEPVTYYTFKYKGPGFNPKESDILTKQIARFKKCTVCGAPVFVYDQSWLYCKICGDWYKRCEHDFED